MKYAILIVGDESRWTDLAETDEKAWRSRIDDWADRLRAEGKYTGDGAELVLTSQAKTIRGTAVTDGPFLESKEVVGGWEIVNADSLEEAVGYAKEWPGVAEGLVSAEVRQIVQH